MFHSSLLPVGMPVSIFLGLLAAMVLNNMHLAQMDVLFWAQAVTLISNILVGGMKNIAMVDWFSLVAVRPLSLGFSLFVVVAMIGLT